MGTTVEAATFFQTGFRTMGIWSHETRLRLDINIWYPGLRKGQDLNYAPWIINAALNAKPVPGKFPLLLLSHASPGTRFSYHYLASYFAGLGYVVVAPAHRRDCMENMDDLFTWNQLANRITELDGALETVLNDTALKDHIDKGKIGFIGFGAGGACGLLLGGAVPNCDQWKNYCADSGPDDPYCSPLSIDKINLLCATFPIRQDLKDSRIKAIAVIAPAYGMLFNKQSFENFTTPLILVGTGRDNFNRNELHCEKLARILGKRANYLELPNADAGALMDSCPKQLQQELQELCNSVSEERRKNLHQKLEKVLESFFANSLKVKPIMPVPVDTAVKK